jgi:anti-sigma factor RsiW
VTCTEFLALLDELIDDEVTVETRTLMQVHLKGCDHCEVTLNTTRKTIQIYRDHEVYDFPTAARERLRSAILAKCKNGC